MAANLVQQLENHLEILGRNPQNLNRIAFFVTIGGLRNGMSDAVKDVFEKHHLADLNVDKPELVFVFEVYLHPNSEKQGTESLKSALHELDEMGIEGIVGPYPTTGNKR